MTSIGHISEIPGEVTFTWKIDDFFQLSDVIDTQYKSPTFYFSGTSWEILILPNGTTECASEGWIGVFLLRKSYGLPVNVNCTFKFKEDGLKKYEFTFTYVFDNNTSGFGRPKLLKRSELFEKRLELLPSNSLTIICTLETSGEVNIADSLFCRYQDICRNLRHIYINEKNTDLKLKFEGDQEISAHRMILDTRSPVFAAMFTHDTKEKQTGEIDIKDVDRNIMNILLEYLYSGDMPAPNAENALPLYAAADKYDVNDIKVVCSEFISRNLSVDWVTDVIAFSELYQIEEVNIRAKEYFKENSDEILESEKWSNFVNENQDLAIKLLSSLVKSNKKSPK